MALLKIAKMGHPVLARMAEAVSEPTDPDIARLIDDMVETMMAAPGIGLAAPQVCVPKRVVVYYVPAERVENGIEEPVTALINPVLTPIGEHRDYGVEGCLSLPDMSGTVPRYQQINLRAAGRDGAIIDRDISGFHARVVQHECDHLDGILYPQRMDDLTTFGYTEELEKRDDTDPEDVL